MFDEATRPYQFALSTWAGTDSLAAMLRAATELDPEATVVALDGRSAYDSVSRAAMLGKLKQIAPQILPFVRSLYARVSTNLWWDDAGHGHKIQQAEGVEQGDSLSPALFALGQHDALAAAARQLEAGKFLAAFLDDIYVVTSPPRARVLLDAVQHHRAPGRGGSKPRQNACLSCSRRPRATRHTRARRRCLARRQATSRAWVRRTGRAHWPPRVHPILRQRSLGGRAPVAESVAPAPGSAVLAAVALLFPRAQHLLRTGPPAAIVAYAQDHALQDMLGGHTADAEQSQRQAIAEASCSSEPGSGLSGRR